MKLTGTKVIKLTLSGALEGQDKVFRGHKFIKGLLIMCCNENQLAAVLNGFRGRLPVDEPEVLDSAGGLVAYKEYCMAAGRPLDRTAVHNLGKAKGQVDLTPLVEPDEDEDSEPVGDVDLDDTSEDENSDTDSESTDSEADSTVDPAVTRENAIRAALGQLDHGNPAHWTSTNLPKMGLIEEILGDETVTRKEVNAIAPDFKRAQ